MPTYDYRCTSCGRKFEQRQSFLAEPVASCPSCGARSERQIVAVPIHFKGSGFYKTDYNSGNGRSSNGSKPADSQSEAKSETKADSKVSESSKPPTEGTAKEAAAKNEK